MEKTRKITYVALFTALVCVLTLFTHIPLPLANGRYVHLGDAAIFMTGILCGAWPAAFAAGVGSAIADILGGAAQWALPTLIVKGVMGMIIGLSANHKKYICPRNFLFMFIAGLEMGLGYFLSEVLVFGIAPLAELMTAHFYFIQFGSGIAAASVVLLALEKTNADLKIPFCRGAK